MSEFKGSVGPWEHYGPSRYEHSIGGYVESGDGKVCDVSGLDVGSYKAKANANLIAAAPELLEALQWALPLAKIAMDTHRMERIKCGHMDITGTYKNGETWVGIYQKEVDEIESARAAIAKALGK